MNHHARASRQRAGRLAGICAALLLGAGPLLAAEEQDDREKVKEGARKVGHTIGSVFREIGHGTRDAVKAVGETAAEGGSAFKRGIKGEGTDKPQGAAPVPPAPQGGSEASGPDH